MRSALREEDAKRPQRRDRCRSSGCSWADHGASILSAYRARLLPPRSLRFVRPSHNLSLARVYRGLRNPCKILQRISGIVVKWRLRFWELRRILAATRMQSRTDETCGKDTVHRVHPTQAAGLRRPRDTADCHPVGCVPRTIFHRSPNADQRRRKARVPPVHEGHAPEPPWWAFNDSAVEFDSTAPRWHEHRLKTGVQSSWEKMVHGVRPTTIRPNRHT